ncbi:hypothetical protein B0H14DRAFT_3784454 [Mycena olivaceomarginata]|nr:hypothetical protein B0H14DRAFT_3784454 [Mycena olivaceomarginata]
MNLHESYSNARGSILTQKDETNLDTVEALLLKAHPSNFLPGQSADPVALALAVRTFPTLDRDRSGDAPSGGSLEDSKGFHWCFATAHDQCHRCGRTGHISVAELIRLITLIAEYHVGRFLPEYAEIKICVNKLPLNDYSAAHPFGGFDKSTRKSNHTWIRFSSEFAPGGLIDQSSATEKQLAWMPSTNDANEGALGAYRVAIRGTLLANKQNAAALRNVLDFSFPADAELTEDELRAFQASTRGGVKTCALAGAIFNNQDDKKGQAAKHVDFMTWKLNKPHPRFPYIFSFN